MLRPLQRHSLSDVLMGLQGRPCRTLIGGGGPAEPLHLHALQAAAIQGFRVEVLDSFAFYCLPGAPPAAPSSGAAGVLSPFFSNRSWRLREASLGSTSSSSQVLIEKRLIVQSTSGL